MENKELKEKLLQSLIDYLDEGGSERLKPKKMAVEVSAPDASKLEEGLEKAKDLVSSHDEPGTEDSSDESDEDRLKALMMGAGDDSSADEEDETPAAPSKGPKNRWFK